MMVKNKEIDEAYAAVYIYVRDTFRTETHDGKSILLGAKMMKHILLGRTVDIPP